jgi:hypothetical protein
MLRESMYEMNQAVNAASACRTRNISTLSITSTTVATTAVLNQFEMFAPQDIPRRKSHPAPALQHRFLSILIYERQLNRASRNMKNGVTGVPLREDALTLFEFHNSAHGATETRNSESLQGVSGGPLCGTADAVIF